MDKIIIFMWLCSVTITVDCKQIKTDRFKFTDIYDCTSYGYSHSTRLIRDFGRKEVNELNLYTKFLCISEDNLHKTKT